MRFWIHAQDSKLESQPIDLSYRDRRSILSDGKNYRLEEGKGFLKFAKRNGKEEKIGLYGRNLWIGYWVDW
ncbi:hypothetical protein LEP1GSC061_1597 [Leptospira wolffii serovar Khorat str. Khorat-H2]|nr:hypothetical protein LEP1GSC061_1597 [Leptospira wolffii serovar Khorat str. Khorat-H2]